MKELFDYIFKLDFKSLFITTIPLYNFLDTYLLGEFHFWQTEGVFS